MLKNPRLNSMVFALFIACLLIVAVMWLAQTVYADPPIFGTTADWSYESDQASAQLGTQITFAGDVNGDGYDDMIAKSLYYDNGQTDEGRAYLFLGSASGLNSTPNWTFETDQASSKITRVCSGGDVDSDGYDDIVVASSGYDNGQSNEGKVWVFHGGSSGPSSSADWSYESNQASAALGTACGAGDVNGDGYDDLVVGAQYYDNPGKAWVFYGSSTGLASSSSWSTNFTTSGLRVGSWVASAGDVNDDGYDDLLIGAIGYGGGGGIGRALVYHGSAGGPSASPDWYHHSTNNFVDMTLMHSAGDVNGDGYDDVAVGEWMQGDGKASIYYGSSTGLSSSADWAIQSNDYNAEYGFSVSSAGDVNEDGYDDVIVSADKFYGGETNEGKHFLYLGSPYGLSSYHNWTFETDQAYAGAYFSSGIGDVNGDGADDIGLGAAYYDNGEANEGILWAFYGTPQTQQEGPDFTLSEGINWSFYGGWVATEAGDVNGDGYEDLIVGCSGCANGESNEGKVFVYLGSSSGISTTAAWSYESNNATANLGISAAGAGDINGDGYDDVIVGAYRYDNGENDEGKAYVFHGSSSGLSTTPDWAVEGNQAGAQFGHKVDGAGDVNGDGYDDIIVGARYFDNGETDEGKAFIYLGSSSGASTTPAWTAESDQASAHFGHDTKGVGDVNGDGYDDVAIGAFYYDAGSTNEGKVFVYFGSSSGVSSTANWTTEGNVTNALLGLSIAGEGDLNGDGYDDLIVGARRKGTGGEVQAFYGSSSGLSSSVDWVFSSSQSGAKLGEHVAYAGDVNGDGYDDLLAVASFYDYYHENEGRVYLFYGSSTGPGSSAEWIYDGNQSDTGDGILKLASGIGDVNGDGLDDLALSAPWYDIEYANQGVVWGFYGQHEIISGLNLTHTIPVLNSTATAFTATVESGTSVTYEWEFVPLGSLQQATGQMTTQTFVPTYQVILTATNPISSETITRTFTVE